MTITVGTHVRITASCAHRTQAGTVTAQYGWANQ